METVLKFKFDVQEALPILECNSMHQGQGKSEGMLATLLYSRAFFLVDSHEERSWRQPQESQ